jgi:hypothetical protein
MLGDLVDTDRERRDTPPSAASELVSGSRDAAFALAGRIRVGRALGVRKQVSTSQRRHGRTQEQSKQEENHGNTEQMRNAETGAPYMVYTCNSVLFMLTGDKGESQAKYALKADAEGGTCIDE